MSLALTISSSIVLAQCPVYATSWIGGPDCGVFGVMPAVALGMNDVGEMCGQSETCDLGDFAFSWDAKGPIVPLVFADGIARAYDMSTEGTVVGEVSPPPPKGQRAFAWDQGNLALLAPLPGDGMSSALGINSDAIVVGTSTGFSALRAFLWVNGQPMPIDLPLGPSSTAQDINDLNQICGWMGQSNTRHGFIWQAGKTIDLGVPNGAIATDANAINNLGDACGFAIWYDQKTKTFARRACAWIDDEFIDLGVLPGGTVSQASDINDAREIVGYCIVDGFFHGFVWRDGVMIDLTEAVPPGMVPADARAINNLGQIAGGGSSDAPDTHGVAFRLTPALPAIPGNTNCDDVVDVDDLINVILHWNPQGPVGGRPADVNRDNRIDFEDLIEVIRGWSFSG